MRFETEGIESRISRAATRPPPIFLHSVCEMTPFIDSASITRICDWRRVSAFSSLNLGIRHVLPIYPFLYAACAIALFDASRRIRIAAAVLVVAQALTAVIAYPSYLSYFNPLIGSARNADRVLIDSNLDWGQDLRRLARWTRENDIDVIRVHYFGAGNVERELGSRAVRWAAPRPEPSAGRLVRGQPALLPAQLPAGAITRGLRHVSAHLGGEVRDDGWRIDRRVLRRASRGTR